MPMPPHAASTRSSAGFSIMEVSMVVAAFALMIAGILIGQSILESSRLKRDIGLIQQVISGAKTFEEKYEFLPGDLPNHSAFFTSPLIPPLVGGNGDNRVGAATGGAGNYTAYCAAGCAGDQGYESSIFWLELAESNMVPLTPFRFSDAVMDVNSFAREGIGYPLVQSSQSFGLSITSVPGQLANVLLYGVQQQTAGQQAVINGTQTNSKYARFIDMKIDDGKPRSGIVQNRWNLDDIVMPFSGANCTDGTNNYPKNETQALCTLRIETKF